MNDLLGRRLAGKYEIQAEIGRGGMGVVYRGHDLMLLRPVAIKVLPTEFTYNQQFVQRFRQEAILAANLHQPNIVTIFDVGEQDGVHYLVMQFLEGVTLDQWLHAHGPMALPQANHMVRQMADALDYAHSHGIVHRDVKPSNIMVGPNGQVTLMDFGLVRAGEGSGLTRSNVVMGTPDYMAPEQALGQPVDWRADIYAPGVVIYKCLTGVVPFARTTPMAVAVAHAYEPPPSPRSLRPDLPKPVEAVAMKAQAKQPAERYQRAIDLAQDLALATATPTPSPTLGATPTPEATPTPDFATARILGKNQDGSWWQIERPGADPAWVVARLVSTQGPADQAAVMEGYRNLMVKYGDANKRIWPTEFGWAAGGAFDSRYAYANDNDFQEQAAWTVEAYQMMRNWGFVGPALLWNLNFRVVANGTEKAQWGIVDPGWNPLPVYNALASMPK